MATKEKAAKDAQLLQSDVAQIIRQVPLFSQLTEEQAGQIAANVMQQRFGKGEAIIEGGHKSNALFIVLTGRAHVAVNEGPNRLMLAPVLASEPNEPPHVKAKKSRKSGAPGESREVIVAMLHPGDHFGEMSMIDGRPHSATVRAEVTTDALVLGRLDFMRCLTENMPMVHAVMNALSSRLRQANIKIQSLALMDVYGRVAHTLLELAVIDEATGEGWIGEHLSRQYLAKNVGASREMVSRVMKDLENRGFITEHEDGTATLRPNLFMVQ